MSANDVSLSPKTALNNLKSLHVPLSNNSDISTTQHFHDNTYYKSCVLNVHIHSHKLWGIIWSYTKRKEKCKIIKLFHWKHEIKCLTCEGKSDKKVNKRDHWCSIFFQHLTLMYELHSQHGTHGWPGFRNSCAAGQYWQWLRMGQEEEYGLVGGEGLYPKMQPYVMPTN